jgi:Pentapeptide repeats (9 copies)
MYASKPTDQLAISGERALVLRPPRKVVRIEVLHLDDLGYGPGGKLTRQQWRDRCAEVMLVRRPEGLAQFTDVLSKQSRQMVSFAATVHLEDGGTIPLLEDYNFPSTAMDLVGAYFAPADHAIRDGKLYVPFLAAGATIASPQFPGLSFNAGATFRHATFAEAASFIGCRFQEFANFAQANFRAGVSFNSAVFSCEAALTHAVFEADAHFAFTQFEADAHFDDALFKGIAAFSSLRPTGDLWFDRASFDGDARFENLQFPGFVRFAHSIFGSSAVFNEAKFASGVAFDEATFLGAAQFDGATFDSETSFAGSTFNVEASFFRAKFCHRSDFEGAVFEGSANFQNATFDNVGHFIRVAFNGESPSFLGVAHKTVLLFRGASFPDPKGEEMEIEHYGALKALSEAQGHGAQSLDFNGHELKARRRSKSYNWLWRFTTWLYEVTSYYGQSYLRPLAILAAISTVTWLLAAAHGAVNSPVKCAGEERAWIGADLARARIPCDYTGYSFRVRTPDSDESSEPLRLSGYRAASEYVLLGGLGIFEFPGKDRRVEPINMRLYGQPLEPWQMRVWGVLRGVAGAALLFLIALGLRNSYRLK